MNKSKLHVLDLMVCSKYLTNDDIYKLKYISKSFKDIQERILTNFNSIIQSDDITQIKIKFPNIQTINICVDDVFIFKDSDSLCCNLKPYYNFIINKFDINYKFEIIMIFDTIVNIDTIINNIVKTFKFKCIIRIWINQDIKFSKQIGNIHIIVNDSVLCIKSQKQYLVFKSNSELIKINKLIFDGQNQDFKSIYDVKLLNSDVIFRNFNNINFNQLSIDNCKNLILENINNIHTFAIEFKNYDINVQFNNCNYELFPIRLTDIWGQRNLGGPVKSFNSNNLIFHDRFDSFSISNYTITNVKLNSHKINYNPLFSKIISDYLVNFKFENVKIKHNYVDNVIQSMNNLCHTCNITNQSYYFLDSIYYTHKHYFITFDSILECKDNYLIHLINIKVVCIKDGQKIYKTFEYEQNFDALVLISKDNISLNNQIYNLLDNPSVKHICEYKICRRNNKWIDSILKFKYSIKYQIAYINKNTQSGIIYYG